jgi:hypothetical protein
MKACLHAKGSRGMNVMPALDLDALPVRTSGTIAHESEHN